ncbi:MAG: HAMP domain-containing histidine kinase, partial [Clostridia bacterium]|nr:HAMP domain-containing histidine kinase [Clostridia bacterium]
MKQTETAKKKRKRRKTYRIRFIITVSVFVVIGLFALFVMGVLFVAEYYGYSLANMPSPWLPTFLLCLFCMLISAGAHYLVVMQIFNPLERLSEGSRRIAKGYFDVRLDYTGAVDELKTTIDNFNQMAKELSSVEMMRNDFIANVSHEFKTPLSSINGYLTLLQDPELSEEERREYIQKTFLNIDRLNDLTENILRLSKLENQQYMEDPVNYRLDEQIRQAVVM